MPSLSGSYTTHRHATHTEYRVRSGSRLLINLDEGDVLENVHINCNASGAWATIVDSLSWRGTPLRRFTIRNLAITGAFPKSASGAISVACRDEALIENVWLGEGAANYPVSSGWNEYPTGILVRPENSGELTMRRLNVQRWVDNGIYASPPGRPGSGRGHIRIENSFSAHNQISCFRLGTEDTIRNCTSETSNLDHRGLWVYNTPNADVRIAGCNFRERSARNRALVVGSGATARARNSAWNTQQIAGSLVDDGDNSRSPRTTVPRGVPLSARDAYTGTATGADEADHVLELAGRMRYRIEHPSIRPHPDHAQWLTRGDAYGDGWAEWFLSGGPDARTRWLLDGPLDDLSIEFEEYEGGLSVDTLTIDGEEYVLDGDEPDDLAEQMAEVLDDLEAKAAEARTLRDRLRELLGGGA